MLSSFFMHLSCHSCCNWLVQASKSTHNKEESRKETQKMMRDAKIFLPIPTVLNVLPFFNKKKNWNIALGLVNH